MAARTKLTAEEKVARREAKQEARRAKEAAALAPVAQSDAEVAPKPKKTPKEKAPKLTPEQRAARRAEADAAARAAGEVARNAAGRPTARGLPCLCGCGSPTVTDEARFVSGHDAKLRRDVLRAGEDSEEGGISEQDLRTGWPLFAPFLVAEGTAAGLLLEGGIVVDGKPSRT